MKIGYYYEIEIYHFTEVFEITSSYLIIKLLGMQNEMYRFEVIHDFDGSGLRYSTGDVIYYYCVDVKEIRQIGKSELVLEWL